MIAYHVVTTTQADIDLLNIDDYISTNLLAPMSAKKILGKIERKIASLALAPERGTRYEKEPWFSRNVRIVQVAHYKIIFQVDRSSKTVTILHVAYARRDLDRVLNQ